MQPLPNQNSPFVRLPSGIIVPPWNSYLQQFTQAPPPFNVLTVGVSPFFYTAVEPGYLAVDGGTVSQLFLTRGSDALLVTGTNLIPMGINDTATVIYSVLPTVRFIPMYGNVTG